MTVQSIAEKRSPSRTDTLLRLEISDALRSRWLAFTGCTYAGVFGLFVWLGLRESSVLGFTGISRVVLNASNAIVLVLPLVALIATCQSVVRARTSGYFELFLTHPCERRDWLHAVIGSRLIVLGGPLFVVLLAAALGGYASGERVVGGLVVQSALIGACLVWAFVGVGLFISSMSKSSERAIVLALLAWLFAVSIHDFAVIGLLLKMRLAPPAVFGLAAANPLELARLSLLSSVDPDLGVLGPVGFWIANYLGPRWTFAAGVSWPFVIGAVTLGLADRRLRAIDLVG
ncbi:MAG TPA: ABC transporter permease [Polyangiaceae bacterium]|nr:ABC transporter permease [Polyangiaceae bacterium]